MDLTRHITFPIITQEVLFQQFGKLQRLLVLLPTALSLSHELRLKFLERLGLPDDLLLEPLDRRGFIGYEELELQQLMRRHSLSFIFNHLIRKEVHAVALGEALGQTLVKVARREGDTDSALDVEGYHTIEQQNLLSLRYHLSEPTLDDEDGKLPKVASDEIPQPLLGSSLELESFFETTVWFVGGDDKIFIDSLGMHLLLRLHSLIEHADISDDETGPPQSLLYRGPNGVFGIVKLNRGPSARLEDAINLFQAICHHVRVDSEVFPLLAADNGILPRVRENTKPCLP
jgi:hypothetical protein